MFYELLWVIELERIGFSLFYFLLFDYVQMSIDILMCMLYVVYAYACACVCL